MHAWKAVVRLVERLYVAHEPFAGRITHCECTPRIGGFNGEINEEDHLYEQENKEAHAGVIEMPHVAEREDHEYDDGVVHTAVNPDPPRFNGEPIVYETRELNGCPLVVALAPEIKLVDANDHEYRHDEEHYVIKGCLVKIHWKRLLFQCRKIKVWHDKQKFHPCAKKPIHKRLKDGLKAHTVVTGTQLLNEGLSRINRRFLFVLQ
jgi:hypothetical protein